MKKKTPSTAPGSFLESFAEAAGLNRLKKTDAPRLYYLSGAVTHDPQYRLKFDLAERYLIAKGNYVINPIHGELPGQTWEHYIACDLLLLVRLMNIYTEIVMIASRIRGCSAPIPLPAIAMIDPDDRAFPSKGSAIEEAFSDCTLPIIKLGKEWNELLTAVIEKVEKEGAKR